MYSNNMRICIALDSGSSPSLKGLKIAMHASGQRCENMRKKYGEKDLNTLQARQILPSDFSYGGVACSENNNNKFSRQFLQVRPVLCVEFRSRRMQFIKRAKHS